MATAVSPMSSPRCNLNDCSPPPGQHWVMCSGRLTSQPPRRIAFLQCVGSRDQSHDYCSAVCCMCATKEAVIAKEHDPKLDIHVFFMDMRAFSKGYWSYFERSRDRYGIEYTRCRISKVHEDPLTRNLILDYPGRRWAALHALF